MIKRFSLAILIFTTQSVGAQYYYNDYLSTYEMEENRALYANAKLTKIIGVGYDAANRKATDFSETQELLNNYRTLRITTYQQGEKEFSTYTFTEDGWISTIQDSSLSVLSKTVYSYTPNGLLSKIERTVNDKELNYEKKESLEWFYKDTTLLTHMIRVQGRDSLEVRFAGDENGNITEEKQYKRGIEIERIYYYYDDENRLTDVVRFHPKLNKLLPDFMIEYDEQHRVIQKITVLPSNEVGYLTWRYIYDSRGLKTKEVLFDRDKKQTGRIEYSYQ